jgi:hypothetical protein
VAVALIRGFTVFDEAYPLDPVDQLPARPVRRAALVMAVLEQVDRTAVVVLDADRPELVRVEDLPAGERRVLGLSPDGTTLLLRVRDQEWPFAVEAEVEGVCLQDLATGRRRWVTDRRDGWAEVGALRADPDRLATVSTLPDPADPSGNLSVLDLVNVPIGARRTLWAGPGFRTGESAVSWSPDEVTWL